MSYELKNVMRDSLSNLVRDSRLEKLSLSLKTPNFFSILRITQNEIRHSNFLAWLLTPEESHNLNTLFLKWFLKELFSSEKIKWANEFKVDSIDLRSIKILREWKHIDIVIKHPDFVIAIENKVKSSEHSGQLRKYKDKIDESFPNLNKGYVFLTIAGLEPLNEEDSIEYIPIDYNLIKSRIEIVLDVYGESISSKIKYYIEDYLLILNREIVGEHESIELARELYENHKEAIDFIIEHKPDRIFEIKETIENTIISLGYKLETCNKYYARFLTHKLSSIIPRTGINGWKGNESFLFEVAYWEKGLTIKCIISPGNEINRKILSNILLELPKSKKPIGKKWLTYYSDPRKINFLSEKYEDLNEVKKIITKLIMDNKEIINLVEDKILKNENEFVK